MMSAIEKRCTTFETLCFLCTKNLNTQNWFNDKELIFGQGTHSTLFLPHNIEFIFVFLWQFFGEYYRHLFIFMGITKLSITLICVKKLWKKCYQRFTTWNSSAPSYHFNIGTCKLTQTIELGSTKLSEEKQFFQLSV